MSDRHSGHCLCGAVRFETDGALREVVACHCEQCRRQTGNFVTATHVADRDLSVEGRGRIVWYDASTEAQRGFCGTCGSLLFWKRHGSTTTSIMAGAFDEPTGLTLARHIFCADKGDYYEIADGLPRFSHGDDSDT